MSGPHPHRDGAAHVSDAGQVTGPLDIESMESNGMHVLGQLVLFRAPESLGGMIASSITWDEESMTEDQFLDWCLRVVADVKRERR